MQPNKFTHGKIKTYYRNDDGSIDSVTESFFENPSAYEREVIQTIKTSRDTLLSDLISALTLISNKKTRKLILTIDTDEHMMPKLLTKTHIETKESYARR